jgi:hypothetical protein
VSGHVFTKPVCAASGMSPPLRWMALARETQEGKSMQSFFSASYVFSLCFPESITNTTSSVQIEG